MNALRKILDTCVGDRTVPGAVGLVARGDQVEVAVAGSHDLAGSSPMARDSIFRIASIGKPVTAAAVMMLIDDGLIAQDDPIAEWLPELASPLVVRTPSSPVDDVVPAVRPITVGDLLDFRAGYGFPSDFSLPAVTPLFSELHQAPPRPQTVPGTDEWLSRLSRIPMLHQPGEAWLYNICSDLQGVLVSRVSGRTLPDFLSERLFEPLGMTDTGFSVPARDLDRFTSCYRTGAEGGLELVDAPDGQWSTPPAFPSGAGGLVSTVDDLHAFARLLLGAGSVGGRRVLSPEAVRQMTTDHLTAAQRADATLFLQGQGWGFGGSVDIERVEPWNVPGRYGWVGGTGTAAHVVPSTGAVTILLTQVEMTGPTPPALMHAFWRYAAEATSHAV
ncbi:serine hydrolase domain-containing protein [Streptomyces sp. NPDC001691]|uniref:serine hydrolase domain-containing protein n=1 Tax=unclassified Streptomyces TaxID=2593676 RepID=UPI000DE8FE2A|nr:serine hydrolase domain-containing protein [Streptomyces sp. SDr-06]RCH70251.1 class A beta-lactamase-related serine hydrolase [Streptomyces sp. SDr-06]